MLFMVTSRPKAGATREKLIEHLYTPTNCNGSKGARRQLKTHQQWHVLTLAPRDVTSGWAAENELRLSESVSPKSGAYHF